MMFFQQTFARLKERYPLLVGLSLVFFLGVLFYANQPDLPLSLLAVFYLTAALVIIYLPKRLDYATALVILVFGSFSAVVSPIMDVPDENAHYARSSLLAEGQLNLNNDQNKVLVSEDVQAVINQSGQPYLGNPNNHEHGEGMISFPSVLMTNVYYNFGYLPQAVGLTVGEWLGLGVLKTYLLGRLMTVLAYAILVFIAVRLSGSLGELIAVAALLPMNIFLSGSFSQDPVFMGVLLIVTALFFSMLSKEKAVGLADIALYTVLCLMLVTLKLPYILFIGLPFFLPTKRFKNLTTLQVWLVKFSSVLTVLLVAIVWYKLSGQIKPPTFQTEEFLRQVDPGKQLGAVLKTPHLYLIAIMRNVGGHLLTADSVNTFGWLTYGLGPMASMMLVFLFSVILNNANQVTVSKWVKLGLFLVLAAIASGISFALLLSWTPVGSYNILGVQGRYFIGLYPLILLFFASNNKAFARCQGFLKEHQVISVSIYFLVLLLLATTLRYYA